MPVPIYLLFSSKLLMEVGVKFSRGRLKQKTALGDSARFLRGMDFKAIYDDGPTYDSNFRNNRHSEVLVRDRLSLANVMRIVCRSAPERDTLLTPLTQEARDRWIERTRVVPERKLFFERGIFLREVNLTSRESHFVFHPGFGPDWRRPYCLWIRWTGDSRCETHEDPDFCVQETPLKLRIPGGRPMPEHQVQVQLNGDLAYLGSYSGSKAFPDLF